MEHEELLVAHREEHEEHPGRHDAIEVLEELRDSLPVGHQELPGIIRAIEVLRYAG